MRRLIEPLIFFSFVLLPAKFLSEHRLLTIILALIVLLVVGADLFQPDGLDEKHKPLR